MAMVDFTNFLCYNFFRRIGGINLDKIRLYS
nr:MAG TPA_asm: hypothetical protein [Caudoviricetes sp.]